MIKRIKYQGPDRRPQTTMSDEMLRLQKQFREDSKRRRTKTKQLELFKVKKKKKQPKKSSTNRLVDKINACPPGLERKRLYRLYLKSHRWRGLRSRVLNKFHNTCSRCPSTTHIQVHHTSYKNLGTKKEFKDLITLCRECHLKEHNIVE